MAAFWAWFTIYYDWFGAGDVFDYGYGWPDLVQVVYTDQPAEAADLTFTEYSPYGWLGKCWVPNCVNANGWEMVPKAMVPGVTYSTSNTYFVWYFTADAFVDGAEQTVPDNLKPDLLTWYYSYFTWMEPSAAPAELSAEQVQSVLTAIGAAPMPLTITLLWDAPVDLDLMFNCDDGSVINYQATEATGSCQGKLDADQQAAQYGNDRGDGV